MKEQGPFDRILEPGSPRDRNTLIVFGVIVVLGIILLVLVLPPVSILSGDGDGPLTGPGSQTVQIREGVPDPPAGWELLSPLFDISETDTTTGDGAAALTVNLNETLTDGRNLALYTLEDDRWRRLGAATLQADGRSARGEVTSTPQNVAVLRRLGSSFAVTGWLPPEAELDPEAAATLTTLNPLDFSPGFDGLVLGAARPRPEGITVRLMPTIRAVAPPESDAVNEILAQPEITAVHVGDIVRVVTESDLDGIDIDYRAVAPELRQDFTQFVTTLAEQLHNDNRTITLTLPLPERAGIDFDTGAYDWAQLAAVVDGIKLATENDQSLFHARVKEALDYLKGRVDLNKVLLVVSPLSHERGAEGINTLTLAGALGLASVISVESGHDVRPGETVEIIGPNVYLEAGASGLRWDDEALAVTFSYPGQGGARTVWIENAFSMAFKMDLAQRYGLGGVAVEDVSLGTSAANVWEPIRQLADSGEVSLVRPYGPLLDPAWEVSAGDLTGGEDGRVIWSAPTEAGAYNLTLIVSDGIVRVGQRVELVVGVASPDEDAGDEGGGGGDEEGGGG